LRSNIVPKVLFWIPKVVSLVGSMFCFLSTWISLSSGTYTLIMLLLNHIFYIPQNLVESLSMKNSILENELAVTRKSSDDTMEKLKDVEGKCNHLQQNLDKYVLCSHMYLKLQDAWLICGIYVSGGPFENNMMVYVFVNSDCRRNLQTWKMKIMS